MCKERCLTQRSVATLRSSNIHVRVPTQPVLQELLHEFNVRATAVRNRVDRPRCCSITSHTARRWAQRGEQRPRNRHERRDPRPGHGCARRHPAARSRRDHERTRQRTSCATFPPASTTSSRRPSAESPTAARVTVAAAARRRSTSSLKEGSLLLSSVIVSATRTPVEASKVASTVNVLTPEQVRQSPARESQDMLREIPAVELPRTSSLVGGTAQIVSIRGVDEGRTAVFFDGIPVNDAWGEWIDWGRVPKAMLDHVEVVEGGTSSLYGNGAMGGVISFFSRPLAPGAMDHPGRRRQPRREHGYVGGGRSARRRAHGERQRRLPGEAAATSMIDPAKRGAIDVDVADHPAQRVTRG